MTAPGNVPGGGAVGDAMSVENNHSLTSPDTSAYSSGWWDRHTVPVTPDSINIPQQTDGYRPGGFGPYTGGDVGHTGAGQGSVADPGNPNSAGPASSATASSPEPSGAASSTSPAFPLPTTLVLLPVQLL
jgi:hypothetical protein